MPKTELTIDQMVPLLVAGAVNFAEDHDELSLSMMRIPKRDFCKFPTVHMGTGDKLVLLQIARIYANCVSLEDRSSHRTVKTFWGALMVIQYFYPDYLQNRPPSPNPE